MDDGNGASGSLVKMEGGSSGGNSVTVYFKSKDCTTEVSRVASNGGNVEKEKFRHWKKNCGFAALASTTKAVTDPDPGIAQRAFEAMLKMKKIDIAAIEAACHG